MIRFFINIGTLLGLLALASCGGSSSDVSGIDGSGAPVATSTNGTIDGFGSVIVNGVRYNSDKAQILINGEPAMEDDLQVGYQVKLTGNIHSDGTATAEKIEFTPSLVGTISAITPNTLVVMGNKVKVNHNTLFDATIFPRSIKGLSIGTRVLISGTFATDGSINATRIEMANNNQQQVLGFVRELNTMNMTFILNQQLVNYAGATINFGHQELRNGVLISVRGLLNSDQLFQATHLQRLPTELPGDIKSASIEGVITRFVSASDFDVGGINITTNPQTKYENGDAKKLALGIEVELDGRVEPNGKLLAKNIEFEHNINNKIAGKVTSISTQPTKGVVTGTLDVDGSPIRTNHSTRYEDKSNSRVKHFNLSSLQIGDTVEVTGYSTEAGFIATKIEREKPEEDELAERELEGIVTSINSDSFTLFGRKIATDENTEFLDADGKPLTAATFFTTAFGKRVNVKGFAFGEEFVAFQVSIDDEDNPKNQFKL